MYKLTNIENLYDGKTTDLSSVHHGCDLFIKKNRIEWCSAWGPSTTFNPDEFVEIDCTGLTVTPGLIDCHSHVTIEGLTQSDLERMNSPAAMIFVERILYRTLVQGGVTTAVDLGGAPLYIKQLVESGVIAGPRLKLAICMLSSTGGHADIRALGSDLNEESQLFPAAIGRPSSIVDGIDQCIKRVREIEFAGADLIKVCVGESIWAKRPNKRRPGDLSLEELNAICKEAELRGLTVAAHAHSKRGAEQAIAAGVHALQHVTEVDDATCEMALKCGCSMTPTSWVVEKVTSDKNFNSKMIYSPELIQEKHSNVVRSAAKYGIPILFGTDPFLPGMHGQNFCELHSLARTGISSLECWFAATGAAAKSLRDDTIGTFAPGTMADLLVFNSDVLKDPMGFTKDTLVEVIKDGEAYKGKWPQVKKFSFNQLLDQVKS